MFDEDAQMWECNSKWSLRNAQQVEVYILYKLTTDYWIE